MFNKISWKKNRDASSENVWLFAGGFLLGAAVAWYNIR